MDGQIAIVAVFFAVWLAAFAVTSVVFVRRRKEQFLRVRSVSLVILSHLFGVLASLAIAISFFFDPLDTLCLTVGVLYSLLLPISFGPMILMIPDLVLRSVLNDEKINRSQGIVSFHWKLRPFCDPTVKIFIVSVLSIIQVAAYLALYYSVAVPGNCQRLPLYIFDVAMVISFLPFGFIMGKIRTVTDPFKIQWQLWGTMILATPLIVITVMFPFAPDVFPAAFDFRFIFITSNAFMFICDMPAIIIYLTYTKRKFLQEVSNLANNLTSLLGGEDYEQILDFARQTWCVENLLFYDAIIEFEKNPTSEKAIFLRNEFLKHNAPMEVNLDAKTIEAVQSNIASGKISETLFREAKVEVEKIIRDDILPRWNAASS